MGRRSAVNLNKIEQELLKDLQSNPDRTGARYKLPGGRTLVFNPLGIVAFVFEATDPFRLDEKHFPFIDRCPVSEPIRDERTLLTPTGYELTIGKSKTPAVVFDHPDGGRTYLSKKLLGRFDKDVKLYQEFSFKHTGHGVKYSAAAVVEGDEIVGYILPVRPPQSD
jgi:hypothetical protein